MINNEKRAIQCYLFLEVGYVILLIASTYSANAGLKMIANLYAVSFVPVILAMAIACQTSKSLKLPVFFLISYMFYGFCMALGYVAHPFDFSDFTKILLGPLFLLAGYNICPRNITSLRRPSTVLFFIIAGIPLLIGFAEMFSFIQPLGPSTFSVFSNRNNASLYAIALLSLYSYVYCNEFLVVLISVLIALSFGTLGIFLAIIGSITLVYFRNWRVIFILLLVSTVFFFSLSLCNFSVITRFQTLITNLTEINLSTLNETSYGAIVAKTGSNDLSFFFRLKHWSDIISIIKNNPSSILLGSGIGASVNLTTMKMVPHNDYLRLFFECGIFVFIAFSYIVISINRAIGFNYRLIPYLAISLYFISENIITNYLAMSLFFFVSGLEISRKRKFLLPSTK